MSTHAHHNHNPSSPATLQDVETVQVITDSGEVSAAGEVSPSSTAILSPVADMKASP